MNEKPASVVDVQRESEKSVLKLGGLQLQSDALVFFGNPGTGKSTIINGILGGPVCPSGLSFGYGLTDKVQSAVKNNKTFYDTPGFFEPNNHRLKNNAKNIDLLLDSDASMSLCFVVKVEKIDNENWDIRSIDADVLRLIMDSFEYGDGKNKIGIIFNQVDGDLKKKVDNGETAIAERLVRKLTGEKWYTVHYCFVVVKFELLNENGKGLITPDLVELYNKLPVANSAGRPKHPIDVSQMNIDKIRDEFERRTRSL